MFSTLRTLDSALACNCPHYAHEMRSKPFASWCRLNCGAFADIFEAAELHKLIA